MILKKLSLLFLVILISACASRSNKNKIFDVVYVMEHKGEFHNKYIRVKGFAYRSFESCVISPIDKSLGKGNMNYDLWFNEKDKGCYAGEIKYGNAIIEGYFDKNGTGHSWAYKASINQAIINWSDDSKTSPYPF